MAPLTPPPKLRLVLRTSRHKPKYDRENSNKKAMKSAPVFDVSCHILFQFCSTLQLNCPAVHCFCFSAGIQKQQCKCACAAGICMEQREMSKHAGRQGNKLPACLCCTLRARMRCAGCDRRELIRVLVTRVDRLVRAAQGVRALRGCTHRQVTRACVHDMCVRERTCQMHTIWRHRIYWYVLFELFSYCRQL